MTLNKAGKWILVGAAVVLLVPFGEGAFSLWRQNQALEDGSAVVSHFLAALNAHQYEKARAMLTLDQQRSISVATIENAEEQVEKKHGKRIGTPRMDEHHANEAYDHITFFYDAPMGPSGDTWIMVRTARIPGGWRVCEYHCDYSPA